MPLIPTLCARKCDIPPGCPILQGSEERPCSRCGVLLFLAPSTLKKLATGTIALVCQKCLPDGAYVAVLGSKQAEKELSKLFLDPTSN